MPTLTNTAMIDGVASMSGLRNAEPEDIAAGIVGLIGKPKRRLAVTRVAGLLIDVTHSVDAATREAEAVTHALRADAIFVDAADKQERRDYEDRARHS